MLVGEWIPDVRQMKREVRHRTLALYLFDADSGHDFAIGAVDFHGLSPGINKPAQLRPLLHILAHFSLKHFQAVAVRFHLNHEIGAKMPERFSPPVAQLPHPAFQRPGGVGRATGTVREHESGRGVANKASPVFLRPIVKFGGDLGIGSAGIGICWGHDDQFTLGSHFKVEIGMLSAKHGEFLVGHGTGGQRSWKKDVVDCQRHGFSVPRIGSKVQNATVVMVQRTVAVRRKA